MFRLLVGLAVLPQALRTLHVINLVIVLTLIMIAVIFINVLTPLGAFVLLVLGLCAVFARRYPQEDYGRRSEFHSPSDGHR